MWGQMDKSQIEDFLKSQVVGRLACTNGIKVYVVPITYAYDNGYIYGHTKDGLKIQMMRDNPTVCFETDFVKDLNNWKSAIAYGTYEELQGSEANKGLEILMKNILSSLGEKTAPSKNPQQDSAELQGNAFQHSFISPFLHSSNKEITDTVVYRIKINDITGKFGNNS